jgi:hypothetical protein
MVEMLCVNGIIQGFSMEIEVNEPIYISGIPTYNLYLEIHPHEQYLYINGVRAKGLTGGAYYQMMEPQLFSYLDEICQSFNRNTEIYIDNESYLPFFIRVDDTPIFSIERMGTTFVMNTELGLDDIRHISDRIQRVFYFKIIPLLKEVGLYG